MCCVNCGAPLTIGLEVICKEASALGVLWGLWALELWTVGGEWQGPLSEALYLGFPVSLLEEKLLGLNQV